MNDLTKGKGEGLVILLHGKDNIAEINHRSRPTMLHCAPTGPPGVGKTLTAGQLPISLVFQPALMIVAGREHRSGNREASVSDRGRGCYHGSFLG